MAKAGDIEMLKAMYNQCELYATYDGRYRMNTALHSFYVPDELVRWLVEQGLNVDIENYYGRTPLYEQAGSGRTNKVKLLLELGADIEKADRYGGRPLHSASDFYRTDTVRFLVENGADIHAENDAHRTPLASALLRCHRHDIPKMADIAAILLEAGGEITLDMIENIKRIGEEFEFHREALNKVDQESLAELETALKKLYSLFDVEPIAKRQMHDGVSPIILPDEAWQKQYETLWDLLVPSSGAAQTVQGEVVRITGRVRDELYRNGGANWDKNYRKMLDALPDYFAAGTSLSKSELAEVKVLTSSIHAKGDDEDSVINRLCELSVLWVLANPNPIPLNKPNYDR